MTVITIHRGEIRQIRKMIKESRLRRGDLYGLHTESKQPVVQIVCGAKNVKKRSRSLCKDKFGEHSLLKIGEWFVGKPEQSYDTLIDMGFNEEGELCSAKYKKHGANLEIIKGQSAFRLFPPITDMLKYITGEDSCELDDTNDDVKDIQSHTYDDVQDTQWYSTTEGEKLFGQIYTNLPKCGFTIQKMSRDIDKQDITIFLKVEVQDEIALYFPHDFPKSNPSVYIGNQDVMQLDMESENTGKGKDLAELLCSCLLQMISEQSVQRDANVRRHPAKTKGDKGEREQDLADQQPTDELQDKQDTSPSREISSIDRNTGNETAKVQDMDTKEIKQSDENDTQDNDCMVTNEGESSRDGKAKADVGGIDDTVKKEEQEPSGMPQRTASDDNTQHAMPSQQQNPPDQSELMDIDDNESL